MFVIFFCSVCVTFLSLMDLVNTPICISQYFVNKQNVRSFTNVIKWNILKKTSAKQFCALLLEDEILVSELPADFAHILLNLKINLGNKSKQDFKEYFIREAGIYLQPVDKEYIFTNCWRALSEIIPCIFFGGNQNAKLFKNYVRDIIFSMKRQHLVPGRMIAKWDILSSPWKDLIDPRKILYCIVIWIFKNILSPIICLNFYVTTCKLDANENKLFYFWKNEWQSFYDKQVSKMVFTKVIKKSEPYSLGKKTKKNHSLASRVKLKMLKKEIPKLHLALKTNNDCRPIVCYKNNPLNSSEKYKMKERLRFLKSLTGKAISKIENLYNTLYMKWVKADKPVLYYIKTDLSNAFGSINRERLGKILSERYINVLKAEKCVNKKQRIAQQYKELINELRKPILIRAGSTVYEWKEGLVQGYKYSPALSELYYTHLDDIYFADHLRIIENQVKLFIRVVDDYLYVTDSLDDAQSFLKALTNYRNVNYDKTVVNFPHGTIKFCKEIHFLGYCYNTTNMQVSRASNIYAGQMSYKIAFTSGVSDLHKFIESRIGQSGIQINCHIFNFQYNNEELIWRHIFTTFCLSANKFCTILAVTCDGREMNEFLLLYKKRVVVKLTNSILETLMRNRPRDFIFVYCINHFRYLSWKALYLCAKLTPKCSGLIPSIQIELAKTNCILGKWREHNCRIETNGECRRKAIKEVCRRIDLRIVFRDFETLPLGFECYHHRRLK